MVTEATLRQETRALIRTLEIANTLCEMAESQGIVFPVMSESLFGESPYRFDFPQRGNAERVSGRVMIYRHEAPGQWSMQFILRCGNHATRKFHTEIRLQCDVRFQFSSRYTIHIKDTYDLVHDWLKVTERPDVKQVFRGEARDAVLLKDEERYLEIMRKMMGFYAEQPTALCTAPANLLMRAI